MADTTQDDPHADGCLVRTPAGVCTCGFLEQWLEESRIPGTRRPVAPDEAAWMMARIGETLPTDERCEGCGRTGWVQVTTHEGIGGADADYECTACGRHWWEWLDEPPK